MTRYDDENDPKLPSSRMAVPTPPQAPLALVTVAELSRDHAPRHRIDIDARVATEQDPINLSLDLVVSVPERRPSSVAIAELAGDDPLRKL